MITKGETILYEANATRPASSDTQDHSRYPQEFGRSDMVPLCSAYCFSKHYPLKRGQIHLIF